MVNEILGLKDYMASTPTKTDKRNIPTRSCGVGKNTSTTELNESLLFELVGGRRGASYTASILASVPTNSEEDEESTAGRSKSGPNKIDTARQMFQSLINRPDATRQAIIQQFEQKINVTHSTAVSYYERLAKEAGLTGKDGDQDIGAGGGSDENDMVASVGDSTTMVDVGGSEEGDDPDAEEDDDDRTGVIRTVANAHLIYKQQTETGAFDELWIYNIGRGKDELDTKRDILAGTDIPPMKTKSPDGSQTFTITTIGNAQYLHITGLPN